MAGVTVHADLILGSLGRTTTALVDLSEPVGQPMISRAGVRGEAHRVRSILRTTMNDQQLIGGK
jgi:hypothetical protein